MISWSFWDISGLQLSKHFFTSFGWLTHHVVSVKGDEVLKIGLVFLAAGAMSGEPAGASVCRTMQVRWERHLRSILKGQRV